MTSAATAGVTIAAADPLPAWSADDASSLRIRVPCPPPACHTGILLFCTGDLTEELERPAANGGFAWDHARISAATTATFCATPSSLRSVACLLRLKSRQPPHSCFSRKGEATEARRPSSSLVTHISAGNRSALHCGLQRNSAQGGAWSTTRALEKPWDGLVLRFGQTHPGGLLRRERMEKDEGTPTSGILSIPYRVVAFSAGLRAAACLAALVIVASVNGSDALATTALALAIITFVVQLIVYVAQADQIRRENELTQILHAQLRERLADLGARAKGTEATMETVSQKLLDRALQQTVSSSKLEDLPPGFTRDVAKNLAELWQQKGDGDGEGAGEATNTEFLARPGEPTRIVESRVCSRLGRRISRSCKS